MRAFCSTVGGISPSRNGFSSSSVRRKPRSRLNLLAPLETQSMLQPIRSLNARSRSSGAREASSSVVSLAFMWTT
jgi:hypothetical protein